MSQVRHHRSSSSSTPANFALPEDAHHEPLTGGGPTSSQPHHRHAPTDMAELTKLRASNGGNGHERTPDYNSVTSPPSTTTTSIPPLGSQKKNRTNIMSGSSATLAPIFPGSNRSPDSGKGQLTSPKPTHSPFEGNQSSESRPISRSPSSEQLLNAINSTNERDRSSTTNERQQQKTLHSSSSVRSLSPIRRPMMIGSPVAANSNAFTKSSSPQSQQLTLSGGSTSPQLASFAHLSVHNAPFTLVPSGAPTPLTTLPQASGIVIALHVSGQVFLTSPETLLKVIQLEGSAGSKDISLLQWMGEDALLKHREAMADSSRSPPNSAGGGSGGGGGYSPNLSSYGQRRSVGDKYARGGGEIGSAEPSPRGNFLPPTLAFNPQQSSSGVNSTIHASEPSSSAAGAGASTTSLGLSFHAPTYSYFLDRNPVAFALVLDYLRDGAANIKQALVHTPDAVLHALQVEAEHFGLCVLGALVSNEQRARLQHRYLSEDDRFWADVVSTIDQLFPNDSTQLQSNGLSASPKGSGASSPRTLANIAIGSALANSSSGPPLTGRQNLQKNIGNMLRRLAFQRDPMLRVCHATYRYTHEYQERLLEILHTNCTLCQRKVYFRPIGLREGRDTGCPVHPPSGQWDRKAKMWTCCGQMRTHTTRKREWTRVERDVLRDQVNVITPNDYWSNHCLTWSVYSDLLGSPDFTNSGCQFTGIHYTTWVFWNTTD